MRVVRQVEQPEVAAAGGGRGAHEFPACGAQAALLGRDQPLRELGPEHELVVERLVDERHLVHRRQRRPLHPRHPELDERKAGLGVDRARLRRLPAAQPAGQAAPLPLRRPPDPRQLGQRRRDVDHPGRLPDAAGLGSGDVHHQRDVVRLVAADEPEPVPERRARLVEVVAVVGGHHHDRPAVEPVPPQRGEDLADAGVEHPGAAVVERPHLPHLRLGQRPPLLLQVGAADELVDVERHPAAVAPAVAGLGEHRAERLRRAVRQVVARVEDVPEERPPVARPLAQPPHHPLGHHLRGDELGKRADLRKQPVAEPVVEVERHHLVLQQHRLGHVDAEVVEARHLHVLEPQRQHLVHRRAPVADRRRVVARLPQPRGQRHDPPGGARQLLPARIHLPQPVGVRVLRGHQRGGRLDRRGQRREAVLEDHRARRQAVDRRRYPRRRRPVGARRPVARIPEPVPPQRVRGQHQDVGRRVRSRPRRRHPPPAGQPHPARHHRHHRHHHRRHHHRRPPQAPRPPATQRIPPGRRPARQPRQHPEQQPGQQPAQRLGRRL